MGKHSKPSKIKFKMPPPARRTAMLTGATVALGLIGTTAATSTGTADPDYPRLDNFSPTLATTDNGKVTRLVVDEVVAETPLLASVTPPEDKLLRAIMKKVDDDDDSSSVSTSRHARAASDPVAEREEVTDGVDRGITDSSSIHSPGNSADSDTDRGGRVSDVEEAEPAEEATGTRPRDGGSEDDGAVVPEPRETDGGSEADPAEGEEGSSEGTDPTPSDPPADKPETQPQPDPEPPVSQPSPEPDAEPQPSPEPEPQPEPEPEKRPVEEDDKELEVAEETPEVVEEDTEVVEEEPSDDSAARDDEAGDLEEPVDEGDTSEG